MAARPAPLEPEPAPDTIAYMAFLAEATRELSSSLDSQEVMRRIAERIHELVDYQLFCIMLWDERSQLLEHSVSFCFGEAVTDIEGGFPLGYGITGTAAAQRRAIRVPDVREDPRYVRFRHREVEIRSELAIPLLVQDRLIGALDLESTELDAFPAHAEQMLLALASSIAIALENARLFERVQREEQRLEEDLATAREIQRGLLPGGTPRMPGLEIGVAYWPARELGGDFYDFLPLGPGRFALAVGDVAGKATAAALYGSLAIGLLRGGILPCAERPAQLLSDLNQQLQLPRVRNRFLTLALGVYDHDERSVTFVNAGMPWPYLVREGRVEPWRVDGFPLGVLPEVRYDQGTLRLEMGDMLVLCSDGMLDGENDCREPFGDCTLQAELARLAGEPAQVVAQGLLQSALAYDADPRSPIIDDRTVVVLRRNGR